MSWLENVSPYYYFSIVTQFDMFLFLDECKVITSEELQHWIRYYFNQGLEYSEILKFLQKYYRTIISKSTLLRRLKDYGLSRRTGKNLSLETI